MASHSRSVGASSGIGESVNSGAETGFSRLCAFQQLSFGHGLLLLLSLFVERNLVTVRGDGTTC